ncbi:MAG TPA: DnaB-like helicase C-terminal domain-containing protein [Roseomonas sp.]|nr:DnaB-like helicase C-terminal domain-containing protein [Roseomonas sp.]
MTKDLITDGYLGPLTKRGIKEDTCKFFGYQLCDDFKGQAVQVAQYHDANGRVVAQKVRFGNKDFTFLGDPKAALGFYGQHRWRDKGKKLIICEGEIDCLTVSQLQDNKWPVVSVKNGAGGAKRDIKKEMEWLLGFEEIVLFFDDDEVGREAVEECAPLLPVGRVKVARIPGFKDANDALKAGQGKLVIDAIWGAKTWRPDGIVGGEELWEAYKAKKQQATATPVPLPWKGLQDKTMGLRRGELWTFTAGSGVGKSAIVRELTHHLLREGETVGMLMLEEGNDRTLDGLIGIELSRPIHLDMTPWDDLGEEEQQARREAFERIGGCSRLHLYDHFGSTEGDNLLNRIRFLVQSCGCGWIILDHLSIVVSGMEDGDERKTIDVLMTKLRTLVQELGCGMLIVSHLRRPAGDKGHEQGAETSLSQLRGSHSIAQLSDCVIGAERDQQDEKTKNITTLRVLKMRFTGDTGIACNLEYDRETGRLREVSLDFMRDDAPTFGSVDGEF